MFLAVTPSITTHTEYDKMGFFTDLFGGSSVGDIVGLGSLALSAADLFKKDQIPKGMKQANNRISQISAALSNPDDPLYQQTVADQEQNIRGDFAQALQDMMTQSQRKIARGGMGLFVNPDRQDEAISSAFLRSTNDMKQQARDNARTYLQGALGANNAAMGAYAPQMQMDAQNKSNKFSGISAIAEGLSSMFGNKSFANLLGQNQMPASGYGGMLNGNPYQTPTLALPSAPQLSFKPGRY